MAAVALTCVSKVYAGGVRALDGVTLEARSGEFLAVLGPSGSGKSTVLRVVAGLEAPTSGTVSIGGRDAARVGPERRDVAMVFQGYALYPHLDVAGNLAFGVRQRRRPAAEVRARVRAAAEALDLADVLGRRPAALSGGQRQRVALGRALVRRPAVALFDEPLSSLDAHLRVRARAEIARVHADTGATALYVTHDPAEALALADRVAVLDRGRLQQVGTPAEVRDRPASVSVALFVGDPPMSVVEGAVADGAFRSASGAVWLDGLRAEGPVTLGVRPEDAALDGPRAAGRWGPPLAGAVARVERVGVGRVASVRLAGGGEVGVAVGADVRVGDAVAVRLDADRAHLFDRTTGLRLDAGR